MRKNAESYPASHVSGGDVQYLAGFEISNPQLKLGRADQKTDGEFAALYPSEQTLVRGDRLRHVLHGDPCRHRVIRSTKAVLRSGYDANRRVLRGRIVCENPIDEDGFV